MIMQGMPHPPLQTGGDDDNVVGDGTGGRQMLRVDVDITARDGTTPLHLACFGGHVHMMRLLLEHGADITRVNGYACGTPHWVAMGGAVAAGEWLWDAWGTYRKHNEGTSSGANANEVRETAFWQMQKEGQTPLHKAAAAGHMDMCRFLLAGPPASMAATSTIDVVCGKGGRRGIMVEDNGGYTAAAVAKLKGHMALSKYLRNVERVK